MQKIINNLVNQVKTIQNSWQLAGFIIVCCLVVIIFRSNDSLIKALALITTATIILFFVPFFKDFLEYLRSKDWNKQTHEYLLSQDPTKSPAYIAASENAQNRGKVISYKHILKEIDELEVSATSDKQILLTLKERIKGAINALNTH